MNVHDFGGFIWAIFVLIAVISSIVRSAKRSVERSQQPSARTQQMQAAPVAPSLATPVVAPSTPTLRVVRTLPPPRREAPAPPPVVVRVPVQKRVEPWNLRGPSLVRGIVALEVLGPPRALREWTPLA